MIIRRAKRRIIYYRQRSSDPRKKVPIPERREMSPSVTGVHRKFAPDYDCVHFFVFSGYTILKINDSMPTIQHMGR